VFKDHAVTSLTEVAVIKRNILNGTPEIIIPYVVQSMIFFLNEGGTSEKYQPRIGRNCKRNSC